MGKNGDGQAVRDTGIDIVGSAPWGSHFCQFYETKQDLIDILVPYFIAGLRNNEFCLWVTSPPLIKHEAEQALRKTLPDLDPYLEGGQIEIIPYTELHRKGGGFEPRKVLDRWVGKLEQARARGYDGLRMSCDALWLEEASRREFAAYEQEVNGMIGEHRMVVICTYSLEKCGAADIVEVASSHQLTLVRRQGRWEALEGAEHRQAREALRQREEDLNRAQVLGRMGSWRLDTHQNVLDWSEESYRMFGVPVGTPLTYEDFLAIVHPHDRESVDRAWQAALRREPYSIVHRIVVNGEVKWIHEKAELEFDADGLMRGGFGTCQDVTEHRQAQMALERTLEDMRKRQAEVSALLEASRATLDFSDFPGAARVVFDACKRVIGASAGYISVLTRDDTANEAVLLDAGQLPCTVDPSAPMPLRGLREKSYHQKRAVYDNDFANSEWAGLLPEGHAELKNVLFAPLLLEGSVVGLLGLANKPKGFTRHDAAMAEAFAGLAAIALRREQSLETLRASEERYRMLSENAQDVIYRRRLGEKPGYEYVSGAVTALTGYTPEEFYSDPEIDLKLVHPDDWGVLTAARSWPSGFDGPLMLRWLPKDGPPKWAEIRRTPILDSSGDIVAIEGVARDIDERVRSMEELDRMRTEFLGMIAHELRTPLAAIKGSVATALGNKTPLTFAETQDLLKIIDEQADRLRDLTGDLLDVTRIEAGALTVELEPVDLAGTIEDAQTIFTRGGRSQVLKLELAKGLPLVRGDRRRIVQVFTNLLDNAAKFSSPASEITVQAEYDATHATVRVTDQGLGIPQDRISDLFKKFVRVGEGGKASVSGTGLGLAICKGIVEAHGGRIWAASGGAGKGATFSFTLPLSVEDGPAALGERGLPVRRGKRTRIVVVDDDLRALRHVQNTLDRAGLQSILAGDPGQVTKLVELEEPALVLLDLRLPGMSGFELLRRIREFSSVPVIFLTASDSEEDTVSALKMGADDYITKPFSPTELLARIEAALRRREQTRVVDERPPFVQGDLRIDFVERRVTVGRAEIALTAMEYKLLYELATHAGQVLTHQQILQRVWGAEYSGETELVRSFVRHLRRKLGDDAKSPRYILTERQVGYRMAKG